MKSFCIKILLIIGILFCIYSEFSYGANIINIPNAHLEKIKEVSIQPTYQVGEGGTIVDHATGLGFSILTSLKLILQGVMLIYMVYIGISMIISMGTDEDKLTKSKNQIWYTLIALVFINIPGTIYNAISGAGKTTTLEGQTLTNTQFTKDDEGNLLVGGEFLAEGGVIYGIIQFLEVLIFGIAIFVIMMAGISMMTSAGKEDKLTAAKNRIMYSVGALIFVGFIEAWKQFAITGTMKQGAGVFSKVLEMALLFAGPVVMIFLTMAGYYYITSGGDEEKVKKAKSILINTFIAIALLLVIVTFLNDLTNFTI